MQILRWLVAAALVAGSAAAMRWLTGDDEVPRSQREPLELAASPEMREGHSADSGSAEASAADLLQPVAAESAPGAQVPLELEVRLVGTLVGSTPERSSALIESPDGSRTVSGVGDVLEGGQGLIQEIRADSVIVLDAAGQEQQLFVQDGGRPEDSSARSAFDMSAEELERLALGQGVERRLQVDMETGMRDLGTTVQLALDPTSGSVQIDRLQRNSPLANMGVRPGDRILEVDGVSIATVNEGMVALTSSLYSEGGSTVFTIERFDGSRVQIATAAGGALRAAPSP